jgi:hypothetical protein
MAQAEPDRLVSMFLDLLHIVAQPVEGDVDGVDDMTVLELCHRADVEHDRIVVVDHGSGGKRVHRILAPRVRHQVPDQGRQHGHKCRNQQGVIAGKLQELLFHDSSTPPAWSPTQQTTKRRAYARQSAEKLTLCPRERGAPHSVFMGAEHFAHHADQLQGPIVADAIKDPVGVFARGEDTFIAQDRKVLRDVALGCADLVDDILHADFIVTQGAKNLQTQGVGHRFDGSRCAIDVFVAFQKGEFAIRFVMHG